MDEETIQIMSVLAGVAALAKEQGIDPLQMTVSATEEGIQVSSGEQVILIPSDDLEELSKHLADLIKADSEAQAKDQAPAEGDAAPAAEGSEQPAA